MYSLFARIGDDESVAIQYLPTEGEARVCDKVRSRRRCVFARASVRE